VVPIFVDVLSACLVNMWLIYQRYSKSAISAYITASTINFRPTSLSFPHAICSSHTFIIPSNSISSSPPLLSLFRRISLASFLPIFPFLSALLFLSMSFHFPSMFPILIFPSLHEWRHKSD
jgi:hypothetical protein